MPSRPAETRKRVVAITSGAISTKAEPRGVVFTEGQTFDSTDELVRLGPKFFMPTDSTSEEIRQAQHAIAPSGVSFSEPKRGAGRRGLGLPRDPLGAP